MRRKIHIVCVLCSILLTGNTFGQSYPRLNDYWDQLYTINPAYINDDYFGTVTTSSRQQWVSYDGAPRTYLSTATFYLDDYYTQFGARVLVEPKGVTQKLDMQLSYAYRLLLANDWRLNMGLGVNFQNFCYDVSELVFPAFDNPQIYDRMIFTNNINANLGFELNYFTWKIGVSSQNIISAFGAGNDLHPLTNLGYVYYRQQNSDWVNWGGGVSVFQYSNIVQGEININAYIKKTYETDDLQIGLLYRTWHELGLIYGMNFGPFKFRISYDYNLGLIRYHSLGTAELMLIYKFNRQGRCRNCGWY